MHRFLHNLLKRSLPHKSSAPRFGLRDDEIETIVNRLRDTRTLDRAILFGSRAMGNYKPASDIDIALYGNKLSVGDMDAIRFYLEEDTTLPYRFDILLGNAIVDAPLAEHVREHGIVLYSRGA